MTLRKSAHGVAIKGQNQFAKFYQDVVLLNRESDGMSEIIDRELFQQ